MSSTLFSSSWYRVATLTPRLRAQARIHRHVYRDEVWYVVQDLASGKFLRFNVGAYQIVALLDGFRTVESIWQHISSIQEDSAPTQDEVIALLSQLHQANLLLTEQQPDMQELETRRDRLNKQKFKQYFSNPLSLRFPLVDPDNFLTLLVGGMRSWVRYIWLIIWLLLMVFGIMMLSMYWEPLTDDITAKVFTPEYLLLIWLAFPVLKVIHELGHGIAIKLFGGQCHEMGVMLLILMPIPYVDASASSGFSNKWQRMLVGAAGMMIELAVAVLALWVWSWIQPGIIKSFLHEIVIIAGISTILFNINPLLRLDGYYILSDWLEIPNFSQKANQYIGYLIKRYMLSLKSDHIRPVMSANEPSWLFSYAVLSFIYRMFIASVILLLVAEQFLILGVILAVWAGYLMIFAPFIKVVKQFWQDSALVEKRTKAIGITSMIISIIATLLFVVPVPMATVVEGVVWMPEQAEVRAPHDCFGEEVMISSQAWVEEKQRLLRCTDPELDAQALELQAKEQELLARLLHATKDRVDMQIIQSELLQVQRELIDAKQRQDASVITSQINGRFIISAPTDFEGRYWERGRLLAYILDQKNYTLLTVVPQLQADLVRNSTRLIEVRSIENVHDQFFATLTREVPLATKSLPSLALALQGGGEIGLEPNINDGDSPQALLPMFQFELTVDHVLPYALGGRVYVRFIHDDMPLAQQWYRQLRDLFLKRFDI